MTRRAFVKSTVPVRLPRSNVAESSVGLKGASFNIGMVYDIQPRDLLVAGNIAYLRDSAVEVFTVYSAVRMFLPEATQYIVPVRKSNVADCM